MKRKRLTVQKKGHHLTFDVGGGVRKGKRTSLHFVTLALKMNGKHADMTMREIARRLANHYEIERGEIEIVSVEFRRRSEVG